MSGIDVIRVRIRLCRGLRAIKATSTCKSRAVPKSYIAARLSLFFSPLLSNDSPIRTVQAAVCFRVRRDNQLHTKSYIVLSKNVSIEAF